MIEKDIFHLFVIGGKKVWREDNMYIPRVQSVCHVK